MQEDIILGENPDYYEDISFDEKLDYSSTELGDILANYLKVLYFEDILFKSQDSELIIHSSFAIPYGLYEERMEETTFIELFIFPLSINEIKKGDFSYRNSLKWSEENSQQWRYLEIQEYLENNKEQEQNELDWPKGWVKLENKFSKQEWLKDWIQIGGKDSKISKKINIKYPLTRKKGKIFPSESDGVLVIGEKFRKIKI